MKIAVVCHPRSWYGRELERSARSAGHNCRRVSFPKLIGSVGGELPALASDDCDLFDFDAVIVRTMPPGSLEQVVYRMDALWRLEGAGVLVLNSAKALECAVDKYLASARLEGAGLLVPPTVVCEGAEAALAAFERLGKDVLVKPLFGSEGRGIVRVSDADLALRTFRTLERLQSVLYVQKFIPNEGFDVRVLTLNGRVIGAIRRRAMGDFRANVSRRAHAETYSLTEAESETALAAAQATGTCFAGVDLLYGRDGACYVIEVNAVPGWRAFQRVTSVDVAAEVLSMIKANF